MKTTIPNRITVARIILVIPFLLAMLLENSDIANWIAIACFILATVSDSLDGYLARKMKQVSDVGKFLDPLADKMLVNVALLCLTVRGLFPVWGLAIVLCRDFAVDGIRLIAAQHGEVIAASWWGKCKTSVQMLTIILLLFGHFCNFGWYAIICNSLIAAMLILTVVSGCQYVMIGWKKYLKSK